MPAGDGTAAALLTLEALGGGDLAEREAMEKLPQRLVNVQGGATARRSSPRPASGRPSRRPSKRLEGRGRVLIRPSGTEPLVRVMVEAPDREECDEIAEALAARVEGELR